MKLRVRYTKLGKVRFLSHRDVARIWERAIRRAHLPIAYSEGFNPRPKLHFGLALSVGHESIDEYLDIDLREGVEVAAAGPALAACLPVGIDVVEVSELASGGTSLQESVDVVVWRFVVPHEAADGLPERAAALLASDHLPIEVVRKAKPQTIDLRPQVVALTMVDGGAHEDPRPLLPRQRADEVVEPDGLTLVAELRTRPRSVRPGELLAALGLDGVDVRVRRLHQFIESDGVRGSPLPVEDAGTAPALREAG